VVDLVVLFVLGLIGPFLTQPVYPLPGAIPYWKRGLVRWSFFWSICMWQVTVPLVLGLWRGFPSIVLSAFIAAAVIGLMFTVYYGSVWPGLAMFAIMWLDLFIANAIVWEAMLMLGMQELKCNLIPLGDLAFEVVVFVIYPIIAYIGTEVTRRYIEVKRGMRKK